MDECQCNGPGYCAIYDMLMVGASWRQCQKNPVYREHLAQQRQAKESVEPTDGPSLPKKAWNFTKAIAAHVATGAKLVSAQIYEQRLNICNECPSGLRKVDVCYAKKCGCNLLRKARWKSQSCPKGHWSDER